MYIGYPGSENRDEHWLVNALSNSLNFLKMLMDHNS